MNIELLNKFQESKVVVFDLDGTLYEDTEHFDYYADCLAQELDRNLRKGFWNDLKKSRAGQHPLKIGRVYDVEKDLILQITIEGQVLKGWDWSGKKLPRELIYELYPDKISCNMDSRIYLGDGWWPPAAIAYHYGLESTECCYLKTKEWINNNDDFLQPLPGLRRALENLQREKTLILATNSDLQDTESILSNLNLEGVFQEIYTSCNKPEKSFELFKNIMKKYDCSAEQLISIGDNYLNEISPVIQLGGEAVLIDREEAFNRQEISGYIIDSIGELIPIFMQLIE